MWDALQTTELRLAMGSFFTEPPQTKVHGGQESVPEATPTETQTEAKGDEVEAP